MGERGNMGDMDDMASALATFTGDERSAEQAILTALGRALAAPEGLPLVGSRKANALFSATPAGKRMARSAREAGYLRSLRVEKGTRIPAEICTITAAGLVRLLECQQAASWQQDLLQHLAWWHMNGPTGDCPIPELYQRARATPYLVTLGLFHDGLRSLHEQQRIYLHPWTGPLCDIPQPECALLVGHEVAYYASLRNDGGFAS
jgi:hypothetical protein